MSNVETTPLRRVSPDEPSPAAAPLPGPATPPAPAPRSADDAPQRPWRRRVLLLAGPLVVLVGALWFYLAGGRAVSEENAYVGRDTVAIAPQVSGVVTTLPVKQNQPVKKDDVLFSIDPEPYRIALAGAQAQLGVTRDQIAALTETYHSRQRQVEQARATQDFAQQAFDRIHDLVRRGVSSQAQLDAAERDLRVAQASLAGAVAEAQSTLAQIGGNGETGVDERPQVRQAQAAVESAERNLRLVTVKAPFDGIATNVNAIAIGAYLTAGQQAISMVADQPVWVDANIKETDLADVRVGAHATVRVDAYPGRVIGATVETINPASGATFALLPPQNASGNWVKVVQRVPVRLKLDLPPEQASVLRAGMTATVSIDTGRRRSLGTLVDDVRGWFE